MAIGMVPSWCCFDGLGQLVATWRKGDRLDASCADIEANQRLVQALIQNSSPTAMSTGSVCAARPTMKPRMP